MLHHCVETELSARYRGIIYVVIICIYTTEKLLLLQTLSIITDVFLQYTSPTNMRNILLMPGEQLKTLNSYNSCTNLMVSQRIKSLCSPFVM